GRHGIEVQRVGRALRRAGAGQVREVDVFDATEHLVGAGRVEVGAGQRVAGQAVDGQCRAPVRRVAALAVELPHPPGRVELQLKERGAGVARADPRVDDVAV